MAKEETVFKAKMLRAIEKPLDPDMDEISCREWMSLLPEAKRYINKKIAICRDRINKLELELEIIEAEIADEIRKRNSGSATERKAIIESAFRRDPRYNEKYTEIYKYQRMIDDYLADIDNLTEKSFSVRKIADFERTHLMYEEE